MANKTHGQRMMPPNKRSVKFEGKNAKSKTFFDKATPPTPHYQNWVGEPKTTDSNPTKPSTPIRNGFMKDPNPESDFNTETGYTLERTLKANSPNRSIEVLSVDGENTLVNTHGTDDTDDDADVIIPEKLNNPQKTEKDKGILEKNKKGKPTLATTVYQKKSDKLQATHFDCQTNQNITKDILKITSKIGEYVNSIKTSLLADMPQKILKRFLINVFFLGSDALREGLVTTPENARNLLLETMRASSIVFEIGTGANALSPDVSINLTEKKYTTMSLDEIENEIFQLEPKRMAKYQDSCEIVRLGGISSLEKEKKQEKESPKTPPSEMMLTDLKTMFHETLQTLNKNND